MVIGIGMVDTRMNNGGAGPLFKLVINDPYQPSLSTPLELR
jgi:hypothetical protein